jgi:hypothetical protein
MKIPSQLSSDTSTVGGNWAMVAFSLTFDLILVFVDYFTRSIPHTIGLFSSSSWQENLLLVGSTHTSSSSHFTLFNYLAKSLEKESVGDEETIDVSAMTMLSVEKA